jgi:hypothetical protein
MNRKPRTQCSRCGESVATRSIRSHQGGAKCKKAYAAEVAALAASAGMTAQQARLAERVERAAWCAVAEAKRHGVWPHVGVELQRALVDHALIQQMLDARRFSTPHPDTAAGEWDRLRMVLNALHQIQKNSWGRLETPEARMRSALL